MIDLLEKIEKDRYTPLKGIDYFTEEEVESIKSEIIKRSVPLIRVPKDGKDAHTHTHAELKEIILPLIPTVENGKDGSPDTPKEVRDKLKTLKGKQRLSVFDLKDTEWLRGKDGKMQWSSAGLKVYTDATLTGDGTFANPLKTVSAGLSLLTTVDPVNNINMTFDFTSAPKIVFVNGAGYRNGHGVTITGTTAITDNPVGNGGDIYALG